MSKVGKIFKTLGYVHAIVKFNSGRGALLCNRCRSIIDTGKFDYSDIEHYCDNCVEKTGGKTEAMGEF